MGVSCALGYLVLTQEENEGNWERTKRGRKRWNRGTGRGQENSWQAELRMSGVGGGGVGGGKDGEDMARVRGQAPMQCWGHALPKRSLACTGLSLPTLSCERGRDPVTVGFRMLPCSGPGLCTFSLVYAASLTLSHWCCWSLPRGPPQGRHLQAP